MKSLFQFLSESQAVQQATRMGLKSDGHGGWYDNKGEFVAKTEKGTLKFFNKRQKIINYLIANENAVKMKLCR